MLPLGELLAQDMRRQENCIVRSGENFFNLYNHDFVRLAVGIPAVRVADPGFNADQTIQLIRDASKRNAILVLFPELGLSAYSCDDLFHQRAVLDRCRDGIAQIVEASRTLPIVAVVGTPLQVDNLLFNCAIVISRGRILGVVPKTYLPNYREFYEARQFNSGESALRPTIELCGQHEVPFGSEILFRCDAQPLFTFHVETCEDLWVPIPPSAHAALAGATVLLNLSASNVTVSKAGYRRQLVESQSARCLAAYLYSAAGPGESTTDLAWDGHALICENGNLVGESERFKDAPQLICAEIDLERLSQERMRQTSFGQAMRRAAAHSREFRTVGFDLPIPRRERLMLERRYERFPYVPSDAAGRDERCAEVYEIQVQGLVTRLRSAGMERVVIGVSGGIDSTHALLVCAQSMDRLGLPRDNVMAYTMPGFATSTRTLEQARRLMRSIGCKAHELDIRPAANQMLADIGHPYSGGRDIYDVTFENVQAGERTSHLFRLANLNGAIVVGTGDLSELALGWCTYGVGDHMSHYAVNASVPKTLIQHVIRWVADTARFGAEASAIMREILATEISPELIPGKAGSAPQATEAVIGPYELQDFNLYYTLRFGYLPTKIAFLAYCAWHDRSLGPWPDIPNESRNQYDLAQIKTHLRTYLWRFFKMSQFKRSCIPNAPKVGSGGSLSPRGDYRAPSDSEATAWLDELEFVPDTDSNAVQAG
ncbi:MAG TPA: NAD(+) synthase [Candidatus Binataceae bacterium]|nr:NAD(+) synthase [Candidatus Binataceae bacterium]